MGEACARNCSQTDYINIFITKKNIHFLNSDKMVGPSRAENVFGQMLICLRMSRLDYMVKETPYSAYVTIRKKFSKAVKDEQMEFNTAVNENAIDEVKNVKNDNIFLRQKIEDLEKELSNLRIDKEEMDLKIIVIEKDKLSLEDEVEEAFSQCKELRNNVMEVLKKMVPFAGLQY